MKLNTVAWNTASISHGLYEIGSARGILLAHLRNILNEFHGVEQSLEYYDLVAGAWLEFFMQSIYFAWYEVSSGNISSELGPIPVIHRSHEALVIAKDIRWHQHLRAAVSKLIEGHSIENWRFDQRATDITNDIRGRLVQKSFTTIATSKPKIIITDPCFKCSYRDWATAVWRWRKWIRVDNMRYPIYTSASIDILWRKNKLNEMRSQSNKFLDLVTTLLPLYIPVTLLEGFKSYRESALELKLHRPNAVYSATSLHSCFTFNLLIAEWRQEGTKLLYHQHGGGYGMEKDMIVEDYELRVSDRYYSWGWNRAGASIRPLSPAITYPSSRIKNDKTLLITTDFPRLPYKLMHSPMPATIELMHRNVCEFLKTYSKKDNLIIRPYPVDMGWGILDAMRLVSVGASFNTRSRLSTLINESRLTVISYLGTTWLETLGLNIPTICFYNSESYHFREEVESHIAALHDVGILHNSGKDVALFIASLGNDIEAWWKSWKVQEVRLQFVKHYANFSPNWMMDWENEFQSIADDRK